MFEKRLIFVFSCLAITILSKMYDTQINIIHKKKNHKTKFLRCLHYIIICEMCRNYLVLTENVKSIIRIEMSK